MRARSEAVLLPAQHPPAGCAPGGDRHGVKLAAAIIATGRLQLNIYPVWPNELAVAAGYQSDELGPIMSKILALYKEAMPGRTRRKTRDGLRDGRAFDVGTVISAMPGAIQVHGGDMGDGVRATGAKTGESFSRRRHGTAGRVWVLRRADGIFRGDGGVLLSGGDWTSRTRTWMSLNRIGVGLGSHPRRAAPRRVSRGGGGAGGYGLWVSGCGGGGAI